MPRALFSRLENMKSTTISYWFVSILILLVIIASVVGMYIKTKKIVNVIESGITFYHDPQDMRDI
jgi:hypothetical protein